jgi:hypothetical protein
LKSARIIFLKKGSGHIELKPLIVKIAYPN